MLGSLDCCVGIGAGRWSAGAERAGALGLRALGLRALELRLGAGGPGGVEACASGWGALVLGAGSGWGLRLGLVLGLWGGADAWGPSASSLGNCCLGLGLLARHLCLETLALREWVGADGLVLPCVSGLVPGLVPAGAVAFRPRLWFAPGRPCVGGWDRLVGLSFVVVRMFVWLVLVLRLGWRLRCSFCWARRLVWCGGRVPWLHSATCYRNPGAKLVHFLFCMGLETRLGADTRLGLGGKKCVRSGGCTVVACNKGPGVSKSQF